MATTGSQTHPMFLTDDYLKFDDSPDMLTYKHLAEGFGPDDAIFMIQRSPLGILELPHAKNNDDIVICMKKPGHGSKDIKAWAKNLNLHFLDDVKKTTSSEVQEEEEGEEGQGMNEGGDEIAASLDSHAKAFWREAYQNWNTYRHFQPKILVAGDVLESMQLRLTFFLHNKEESEQVTVKWPLFDHGLRQVSYSELIWHHFRKEKEKSWIEDAYEKDWVEFCLWYAEVGYIRDLQSKGFTLCGVDENMLALDIQKEMVQYVTILKQDRNVSAHIFSTAIQQKTSDAKGERSQPKVRILLDSAVFDLSAGMKGNLLRMIQDLTVILPQYSRI